MPSHDYSKCTSAARTTLRAALLAPLLLLAMAAGSPAMAQQSPVQPTEDPDKDASDEAYRNCLAYAWREPTNAFESAIAWASRGGGDPAQRCAAIALFALGKYDRAAYRLQVLAQESTSADAEQRAGMLAQSAQAWMLAEREDLAIETLNRALELVPDEPTLLIDRARALGSAGRFQEALTDLTAALQQRPEDLDGLIFRASALRQLGDLNSALIDAEYALQIAPDNPDALLERGSIRRLMEDREGARADWLRVIQVSPNTPVADFAQRNLALLDVQVQ